ncbi:MAG: HupE/UreJ family protein [Phormidesmis sp.]
MKNISLSRRFLSGRLWANSALGTSIALLLAAPAIAHHPFGGEAPSTFVQGFLSGIGHPVIGLDHLAFVIAAGLLAAVVTRGVWVPVAFVVATLLGTGIHLAELDLPMTELVIATSVLLFGGLAVMRDRLNPIFVIMLAALAGVFHGYAYGEAVVGAEPTPLLAYLLGFAGVQGAIAYTTYLLSKRAVVKDQDAGLISVRHAGFTVLGVGAAFLGGLVA